MKRNLLFTVALSVMIVLTACSGNATGTVQPTAAPTAAGSTGNLDAITVNVADNSGYGKILVNSQGMTLYLYTKDTPNTSTCYDTCATNWPPLIVTGTPTGGAELDATKLGTTQRTDGSMQVTYNGWPLYTYIKDTKAGDTNGQNVGSIWFVVSPAGEKVTSAAGNTASTSNQYDENTSANSSQAVTEGNNIAISIANFQFSPNNLIVHVGTTVTWTNSDSAPHTITADDGSFSSGTLNQGGTFAFTFTKEGSFTYYCANHTNMIASITVVA
ncbi:uncharacterized protein conserved in bacteria [Longilinea arvoryzae]|uniref:Uncharacterized protein conserved in bacteria n=1 Tax=Longilinea arvoryzae TaxID=360412 RepID=A0A0S7BL01_9CHLR|nr:plastocyanin/azurin family copper-binding protein [Longilinea arvoryzae]GAP14362.1 uncharacterized protein conserved in bacteria [Longilinea arvoryzae]